MSLLGVNASIGNESEQMQPSTARARMLHGGNQCWIGEKVPVLDHQINACDVHVHDSSGPDIQVADLAVAHLALGQTDKRTARMNQRIGILAEYPVIRRLARQRDRICLRFGAVTPSVKDDENKRFGTGHAWLLAP